jgi:hypothetical protein
LLVAQEVCGMWHLLFINPSAAGQQGGIVNVSDTQICTHSVQYRVAGAEGLMQLFN